jgi:hypothetical protein
MEWQGTKVALGWLGAVALMVFALVPWNLIIRVFKDVKKTQKRDRSVI